MSFKSKLMFLDTRSNYLRTLIGTALLLAISQAGSAELAFRPSDGAFAKWYESATPSPDFNYQEVRYIGGAPNAWQGAQMIPDIYARFQINSPQ